LGTLALLTAAFLVAELVQRSDDELLPEPLEGERFSLSAPVHVAAIIVLGPWAAALVGLVGTCAVRPLRGEPWRKSMVRGAGLAVAALAGGFAFQLAGATTGTLEMSEDLLAVAVLGMVYGAIKSLSIAIAGGRLVPQPDVLTAAAEVGLGLLLAFAALENLWLALALCPALLLLDRVYGRTVLMRREMATALETFANIVDERDSSTHGHSVRVAGYVRELATGLGLPRADVARLWWAGRLHDLGKVAVDAAVLRKPGKLTPNEWGSVWRAPRLSARLLQRFRFAAQQAQAVEYHRERYDGSGYYGARSDDTPLAAHFLIVADAFDAMTTDRSFRARLSEEEALLEIERASGSQFHPVVAAAFVAVRRGVHPATVLAPEDLEALRDASVPHRSRLPDRGELRRRPELIALAGGVALLVGLGTRLVEVAAAGLVAFLGGVALWGSRELLTRRLGKALDHAMEVGGDRNLVFEHVDDAVTRAWDTSYSALVAWDEDGAGGSVVFSRGEDSPPDPVLISWLLREAESGLDLTLDVGGELGAGVVSLALPLRRENNALLGFLVLRASTYPPWHLLPALQNRLHELGLAFAETRAPFSLRPGAPAPKLDADGREHAGALEA
jgi:HD-GYP domain-containing protein (c-di-GMP phosphodiesterase class II)